MICTHTVCSVLSQGFKECKRIVCGGCLDFKVVTSLAAGGDGFGAWEAKEFAPEKEFIEALGKIEGVSAVETQTFTFMTM